MILQQNTYRPKGFMVWDGVSSKGKTSLRFVEPGAKINSAYYIKDHFYHTMYLDYIQKMKENNGFFIKIQHPVIPLKTHTRIFEEMQN